MAEGFPDSWEPLGVDGRNVNYHGLVEGMPQWMLNSVRNWVKSRFTLGKKSPNTADSELYPSFDVELLRQIELRCRFSIMYFREELGQQLIEDGVNTIFNTLVVPLDQLKLLDALLIDAKPNQAEVLNKILIEGGSAYHVGEHDGVRGLIRRVEPTVQARADRVIARSAHAGVLLGEAWQAVYALQPNPSEAYRLAVKAVEEVAIPKVIPLQTNANLGHVAGEMEANGDWFLPSQFEVDEAYSGLVAINLIRHLWHGHHDRHGGRLGGPTTITQKEAESALSVAITLVEWFSQDLLEHRDLAGKKIYYKKRQS